MCRAILEIVNSAKASFTILEIFNSAKASFNISHIELGFRIALSICTKNYLASSLSSPSVIRDSQINVSLINFKSKEGVVSSL